MLSIAIAPLLLALAQEPSGEEGAETPPSVLLIVADDQGYADLSCAGLASDVQTPNIDRLAASGVRFTQAYASSPICNASRAALITGCYQQRFGTFWYGGKGLPSEGYPTLPELLRAEGYRTGYVGKFHYGSRRVHQPGARSFPLEHGFEQLFGCSGGRKHYLVHEAAAEERFMATKREHQRTGQSLEQGGMWVDAERLDQEGLSTELFGARAREFLAAHADAPFFLQLSFNAVHNFTHQLPPEYLREHGLEGRPDWDPAKEEYLDWYYAGRAPSNPEGRAHYLGQLFFLDRELGRVLDALEELGLRERTLVVYVGDNGGSTPIYADNGPLRGSKFTLYEGGIRVPLIISWPGRFEAGAVRDNVVSAMDILPTLVASAGAEPPTHLDGLDLGPLLRGEDPELGHELLVWDTGHETAVRSGRWKLKTAASRKHAEHEGVEVELGTALFDLAVDPGEGRDLSGEHPELVEELIALHARWRAGLEQ